MICAAALPSVRKRRFSLSGRPASASTNRGDGEVNETRKNTFGAYPDVPHQVGIFTYI
jgi:hypothetical protein